MEEELCIKCMRCVAVCPVKAIAGTDYPDGITDKIACATRSEALPKTVYLTLRTLYQSLPGWRGSHVVP
ncbi:MAG: 4Fe-4S binding protein [Methanoregula sp.]|nr:4Fe-4S binding protein [Methanoregula sp.]